MKYTNPKLEVIRFENYDILTDSDELPIIPAEIEEPESFDEPVEVVDPTGE